MNKETIKFNILLESTFWDKPPKVQVFVNDVLKFQGEVIKSQNVVFNADLEFNRQHKLTIIRQGKTPDQTQGNKDQLLIISSIEIDGVNIRDIVFTKSKFIPEYPESWAFEQASNGIDLEKEIIGETILGHNGIWYLDFSSPFYRFLIHQFK